MCNAYTVRPKVGSKELVALLSKEIGKLKSPLVRRTGPGVVLVANGSELQPATMRWGFERPFSKAINNARSDNFQSLVWSEALKSRRCLVPISTFFEWKENPDRSKQAYEFRRPDDDWMWVAGLYEPSDTHGPCYATITTEPPPVVEPIHDRMLAVLEFEEGLAFLRGETLPFTPYVGAILATPCASPLKRTPPPDPQGELF